MDYEKLTGSYIRGKQITVLIVILVSLVGMTIDTVVYFNIYPLGQQIVQFLSIGASFLALVLIMANRKRFYHTAYLICVYGMLLAILSTSYFYEYFKLSHQIDHTNIGLRDAYFVIIYMTISGFVISKKHIVIQGILLNLMILYYTFYLKNPFFVDNLFVNLLASVGFIIVCFFLVKTIQQFTDGLNQAVIESEKRRKLNIIKTRKLENYQNALINLTKADKLYNQELEEVYVNICQIAGKCLGIERVSIWLLRENSTVLVRKTLYTHEHDENEMLLVESKDYPNYFRAMKDKLFIKANNVYTNADTKEFTDSYLEPLNICSMLDCLFRLDGEPAGIICCESQGKFINWTTEDVLFVQSLADYIAIANKNQQIKFLLEEIKQNNSNLEAQVKENITMNEELNSLNEELMSVNESLEKVVQDRTSTLQTQNEQLIEYAFINSHLLRAPIARILGLATIITSQVELDNDRQLLEALSLATQELDEIVKKISDVLYDSNYVSRADIKGMITKNMMK
ncbi:GAF domain-containing protein [Marivirga sp. S37H4]|uniref:GAF domain-containing protein n=1 Tax=Marivirga aurantiaca TaxID=2802615 RepID=A0A934WYU6_9BACT|nr:GAF domain-containing protein [Marivirga aurantiaca]MBK6265335.1 GAF domain-containing protein [Marivirga aurantiaca]